MTLFDRRTGDVRLTRAGEALVPYAERMVASWEEAKRSLSQAADCAPVVGMHTSLGRQLLPALRAELLDACPDAALDIRHVPWDDRTGGLADRTTDAAFVWLPLPQPPYAGCPWPLNHDSSHCRRITAWQAGQQ